MLRDSADMEICGEIRDVDLLSEKQIKYIAGKMCKPGSRILSCRLRRAADQGILGFLGDHFRMVLCVKENESLRKINLFIKTVPTANKPKADFICQNNFFKKEAIVFKMIGEMQKMNYLTPWCASAVIYNEKMLVMPDLAVHGYRTHPTEKCFDKAHVFTAVSSLARFHAAFANYFTDKLSKNHTNVLDDYIDIITECTYQGTWLRAAAKLTCNLLNEFSLKGMHYRVDLEDKLWKLFIEASDRLNDNGDAFKVLVHGDLWANNILFQYTGDEPTNAVLIDFQLIKYAPPEFDVMSFLYLTTSRDFRDRNEDEVLRHYHATFMDNIVDRTAKRLRGLNYDIDKFLVSCEGARVYGLVNAITIFPYVLMEPSAAQQAFDDPDSYMERLEEDRSGPVLGHARQNAVYLQRQLEVCEELVEKYVV